MAQSSKLITIFGGTGFVGNNLAKELAARGHRLRIVSRSAQRQVTAEDSTEYVSANILDAEKLGPVIEGSDHVVNLVAILFETAKQKFDALHHLAAKNIAEAAAKEGSGLTHISSIGANKNAQSRYAKTKYAGELAVMDAMPKATILQPSIIFGPEDAFFNRFNDMTRLSPVLPLIGANTNFQPVYVGDVAKAIANVIEGHGQEGANFELGGPETKSFRQLMQDMMAVTGRRRLIANLPFPIAKLQGKLLGLLPKPPLTEDQVISLKVDNVVSAEAIDENRTLSDLGVEPTPLGDILPSYLAS